jgi:hypothetical protein
VTANTKRLHSSYLDVLFAHAVYLTQGLLPQQTCPADCMLGVARAGAFGLRRDSTANLSRRPLEEAEENHGRVMASEEATAAAAIHLASCAAQRNGMCT